LVSLPSGETNRVALAQLDGAGEGTAVGEGFALEVGGVDEGGGGVEMLVAVGSTPGVSVTVGDGGGTGVLVTVG
jgi:hypothetical protein